MDKYEYKLKLEQLKNLVEEKDYKIAAEIADSINWRKVKSAATLCMVGEIYDRNKRYEDSFEILQMAYDRAAVGRNILYRLTLVSLKMGNLDEAKEYYEEFLEVAPYDSQKYILRYQIAKLSGADLMELIDILEEFKDRDYTEEWAFELAYLYHRAGNGEKCAEVCDELELLIGDGKYVEKALELKMLYQPLNEIQEQKYRKFKQNRDGMVEVRPTDMLESGEIIQETIQIPDIAANTSRFNTSNLQAELAANMRQIMNASTKETVNETMDNIKKIVEEIPYLQMPSEETEHTIEQEQYGHIETDEEIDDSLRTDFQEMLAEDWDGQIRMSVQGGGLREPQVNGQMKIDDVLAEWERTRMAAEAAMAAAQQRRLESAKARALLEAQDLMERLNQVIPKLEAGISPQELMAEHYLQNIPEEEKEAEEQISVKEPQHVRAEPEEEIPIQQEGMRGRAQGAQQDQSSWEYPEQVQKNRGYPEQGRYRSEGAVQGRQSWGYPEQERYMAQEEMPIQQEFMRVKPQGAPQDQSSWKYPGRVQQNRGYPEQERYRQEETEQVQHNWGYPEQERYRQEEAVQGRQSWGYPEQERYMAQEEMPIQQEGMRGRAQGAQQDQSSWEYPEQVQKNRGYPEQERYRQEEAEQVQKDWGYPEQERYRQEDESQRRQKPLNLDEQEQVIIDEQDIPVQQEGEKDIPEQTYEERQGLDDFEQIPYDTPKETMESPEDIGYESAEVFPEQLDVKGQEKQESEETILMYRQGKGEEPQEELPEEVKDQPEEGLQREDLSEQIASWEEAAKILGEPIPEEYLAQIQMKNKRGIMNLEDPGQKSPMPEIRQSKEHGQKSMDSLEELIEQQAARDTPGQEDRDAELYLESVFRAAKASREEKIDIPKIKIEEPEEHIRTLTPEQKEIFSYFVPVTGMEQQLCQVLEGVLHRKEKDRTSSSGNILITGGRGSGKTVLATDFIKAIQKSGRHPGDKVGKITGESLNQKDLNQLIKKVYGGYLIIEKAGDILPETATRLSLLMEQDTDGMLVIMEDTRAGIEKVLSLDANFAKQFTERIKIPVYTSDELVEFAKAYAKEQECEIDDMGILALYNRISSIQKLDEATTLTEVKDILDDAIKHADRGGFKKLFGGKKFSPDGYLYLREKDFEH